MLNNIYLILILILSNNALSLDDFFSSIDIEITAENEIDDIFLKKFCDSFQNQLKQQETEISFGLFQTTNCFIKKPHLKSSYWKISFEIRSNNIYINLFKNNILTGNWSLESKEYKNILLDKDFQNILGTTIRSQLPAMLTLNLKNFDSTRINLTKNQLDFKNQIPNKLVMYTIERTKEDNIIYAKIVGEIEFFNDFLEIKIKDEYKNLKSRFYAHKPEGPDGNLANLQSVFEKNTKDILENIENQKTTNIFLNTLYSSLDVSLSLLSKKTDPLGSPIFATSFTLGRSFYRGILGQIQIVPKIKNTRPNGIISFSQSHLLFKYYWNINLAFIKILIAPTLASSNISVEYPLKNGLKTSFEMKQSFHMASSIGLAYFGEKYILSYLYDKTLFQLSSVFLANISQHKTTFYYSLKKIDNTKNQSYTLIHGSIFSEKTIAINTDSQDKQDFELKKITFENLSLSLGVSFGI